MTACGDNGGSGKPGDPGDPGAAKPYALLRDDQWTIQEAIDPSADDPAASAQHPPTDWYVEYVNSSSASESQMVVVNGVEIGFEESISQLSALTFELNDVSTNGWRAVGGTSREPTGPALLVLEHGERSIIVLSYELSLDELTVLAARIEPIDAAAWTSAGGVIR